MNSAELIASAIRLVVEQELDAALARRGLAKLTENSSREAWRTKAILSTLNEVADSYNITTAEILASGRKQPAAEARQLVSTLLRRLFLFDRSQAVKAVGRMDYTTYFSSESRTRSLYRSESAFRARVDAIAATLTFTHDLPPERQQDLQKHLNT